MEAIVDIEDDDEKVEEKEDSVKKATIIEDDVKENMMKKVNITDGTDEKDDWLSTKNRDTNLRIISSYLKICDSNSKLIKDNQTYKYWKSSDLAKTYDNYIREITDKLKKDCNEFGQYRESLKILDSDYILANGQKLSILMNEYCDRIHAIRCCIELLPVNRIDSTNTWIFALPNIKLIDSIQALVPRDEIERITVIFEKPLGTLNGHRYNIYIPVTAFNDIANLNYIVKDFTSVFVELSYKIKNVINSDKNFQLLRVNYLAPTESVYKEIFD